MAHNISLSPYINTRLYTQVTLTATQLTNEIYQNLKNKLVKENEKKCFRHYGYVVKIHDISHYEAAPLQAENPHVSVPFKVAFSCRLCVPLEKQHIIAKIEKMSELFLVLSNGPIYIVVTIDRRNEKVFFVDNNNRLRYRSGEKSTVVKQGDFVKISLESKTFNSGDYRIKALGFLQEMATEKEVESFYEAMYQEDEPTVEFDEHVKDTQEKIQKSIDQENTVVDEAEVSETSDEEMEPPQD